MLDIGTRLINSENLYHFSTKRFRDYVPNASIWLNKNMRDKMAETVGNLKISLDAPLILIVFPNAS